MPPCPWSCWRLRPRPCCCCCGAALGIFVATTSKSCATLVPSFAEVSMNVRFCDRGACDKSLKLAVDGTRLVQEAKQTVTSQAQGSKWPLSSLDE